MHKIKSKAEILYEDIKGVLYRVNHLQDEFENNFFAKHKLEKDVKSIINDHLKTTLADCYSLSEILYSITLLDSDEELRNLIESQRNEFQKSA